MGTPGPHSLGKMGTPGPHFTGKMGTRVPILPLKWGPGVPILGGPHFPMTPGFLSAEKVQDSFVGTCEARAGLFKCHEGSRKQF